MMPAHPKTSPIRTPIPILDDWFNYVFTYFPTTNWQHAFSPTINFGCNVQDVPVEEHVVDKVGSYGYQLNRILNALQVVIEDGKFHGKTAHDKDAVSKLLELAHDADQAAREFQGEATEDGVHKLVNGMRELERSEDASDRERYKILVNELHKALP
jgi:hypothetical protein